MNFLPSRNFGAHMTQQYYFLIQSFSQILHQTHDPEDEQTVHHLLQHLDLGPANRYKNIL